MSILVACKCGKQFKAADQHAGKRTRCPGCGQPLTIPQPAPPTEPAEGDIFSLGEPEVFQPSETSASPAKASASSSKKLSAAAGVPPLSKSSRNVGGGGAASHVSVSPMIIVLIILAILIPAAVYWAEEGPIKAYHQWVKASDVAETQIPNQISRAALQQMLLFGMPVLEHSNRAHVLAMNFAESKFMMSLPDQVFFAGRGTGGTFTGEFYPKTMQFEAKVEMFGAVHQVKGSASDDDNSLTLDGTPVPASVY